MKIKKRNEGWKAIAGLLVLAVVAIGLGLLFREQQPTPVATLPTVATATEVATQTAEPTMTPAPTATPALPTGTPGPRHLSAAVEVPVPEGFLDLMDLDGDTAVGRINVNGENQIVLIDLVSGDVRQISSATGTVAKYSARISGYWVVWSEEAELADRSIDRRLKVYDREKGHEFELEADPGELDLSGNVVVWEEWRGQEYSWDIFAYNLKTGTKMTVVERPGAQSPPPYFRPLGHLSGIRRKRGRTGIHPPPGAQPGKW